MDPEWSDRNICKSSQKYAHVDQLGLHTVPSSCYNCCAQPRSTSRSMLILIRDHQVAPLLVHKVIS